MTVSLGRLGEYLASMPKDVALRSAHRASVKLFGEYEIKTWSNRAAMLQAVRMSDTGALGARPFKPCAN